MKVLILAVSMLVFLLLGQMAHAQEELEFGDTGTTNTAPTYRPKHKEYKQKHLIQIIKSNANNLLQGNRCMDDLTAAMGFQYVVQPKGQPGNKSDMQRWLHNFGAKLGILFKNGPFWKIKLNKGKKNCRQQTGDFMG